MKLETLAASSGTTTLSKYPPMSPPNVARATPLLLVGAGSEYRSVGLPSVMSAVEPKPISNARLNCGHGWMGGHVSVVLMNGQSVEPRPLPVSVGNCPVVVFRRIHQPRNRSNC